MVFETNGVFHLLEKMLNLLILRDMHITTKPRNHLSLFDGQRLKNCITYSVERMSAICGQFSKISSMQRASQMAQWWRIHLPSRRYWFDLWVGKIPWKRKWYPTPVFLPVKSHGLRSLVILKKHQMWLSNETTTVVWKNSYSLTQNSSSTNLSQISVQIHSSRYSYIHIYYACILHIHMCYMHEKVIYVQRYLL